jgi:four helix bundle protein
VNKETPVTKNSNSKPVYDLEERTFQFAKRICLFCKKLPRTISNIEYVKQVIRASGSVGSNYIEANESLSKKDFIFRIKICRKEATEFKKNFSSIIEKSK